MIKNLHKNKKCVIINFANELLKKRKSGLFSNFFYVKEKIILKKELNLGKEKIGRLLLAFSVPCIISMLINSIYNIVDQIFIGQGVGYLGNAATNVIFPIVIFCNAVAGLIGNGCAANLSLRLGEKKGKRSQ